MPCEREDTWWWKKKPIAAQKVNATLICNRRLSVKETGVNAREGLFSECNCLYSCWVNFAGFLVSPCLVGYRIRLRVWVVGNLRMRWRPVRPSLSLCRATPAMYGHLPEHVWVHTWLSHTNIFLFMLGSDDFCFQLRPWRFQKTGRSWLYLLAYDSLFQLVTFVIKWLLLSVKIVPSQSCIIEILTFQNVNFVS